MATSSGNVVTSSPSRRTTAKSGRRSIRLETERRERSTAICSNSSPTWKNSMTAAASFQSCMARAQTVARAIRNFSSKICPRRMLRRADHRIS